jgi:hypothetical protein
MYLDLLDGAGDSGFQTERLKVLCDLVGQRPRWMREHGRGGDVKWCSPERQSALMGFTAGAAAREVERLGDDEVAGRVLQGLAAARGRRMAEPVAVRITR